MTLYGGRGSGKSRTITLVTDIVILLQKRFVVVARDYKDDVQDSIWRNIIERIYELELDPFFKITKERITCTATGTEIIPFGLIDNPDKIKSLEGCDLLIMEESAKTPRYVWEKVIPTIRENGASIVTIYNPDWEYDETHDLLVNKQESLQLGRFTRHINYLDNTFCPKSVLIEAETMKREDFERYEHIYLGKPRKTSKQQIFNGCYEIVDFQSENGESFPMHPNHPDYQGEIEYMFGVALGFSQKPSFVVRCFFYKDVLYVDYEYHGIDIPLSDLARITFNLPENEDSLTFCDPRREQAAERFYDEIGYFGGSVIVADKWTSDVIDSIIFIRNKIKKVVIHPRCKYVKECFDWYFWEYDEKENEVLDKPIEKNDQAFHAIRFAINNYIQGAQLI